MKRTTVLLISVMALVLTTVAPATAADISFDRELPTSIDDLKLSTPLTGELTERGVVGPSLTDADGNVQVVIRLSSPASSQMAAGSQVSQLAAVQSQQSSIVSAVRGIDGGAVMLASVSRVLNAVIMEIDASSIAEISRLDGVVSMNRVIHHELDLSETVPYIGASAVQDLGYDGSGVEVAVLDSGIDYLHANLGGSGDVAEFDANDPQIIEKGTFPTAKVVGGYDFVGPNWVPGLAEEPDPDPLDAGAASGHGTHVADIIAGTNGVAPGAVVHAVKVCSSVSSSCSGIALLQGMDYAVDPDGDGDTSDAVDIINMSLGSIYGQWYDDDLSQAVENATAIGVLTVASAGNSADKPYVTGSPAAAPSAVSVAQTQVPSAIQPLLEVTAPESIAGQYAGVFQTWSTPPAGVITADVIYADSDGDANNLNGCAAFDEDLTGYIVLVDRGACSFTSKILNVEAAGGIVGIIGLIAPGDPFAGGFGGEGFPTIPGYMISQADSLAIQGEVANGVSMTIDPNVGIPLVMHMVGSSARGPEVSTNKIKPDIGAPGASVSAVAGTGTETTAFGGTSGAAPMVAGAAALLVQAYPDRSPAELKSVMMNTGETNILNIPEFFGGDLAPIMRIGGGEVRVDSALNASGAAWDSYDLTGSLSFGPIDVWKDIDPDRSVTVINYTNHAVTYDISSSFRFANDDHGAVNVVTPPRVTVPANGTAEFPVQIEIDASELREWAIGSGPDGSSSAGITYFEYDGYIHLTPPSGEALHVAWHVMPRKADAVKGRRTVKTAIDDATGYGYGEGTLHNVGAGAARIEAFSLLGRSPDLPPSVQGAQNPITDLRYFGVATYDGSAVCGPDTFLWRFAVNTWEDQSTANVPNAFIIAIDLDGDGISEYEVYNFDLAGLGDGRNVTWVDDFVNGTSSAFFFTEHSFNSGNTVLTTCSQQFGLTTADLGLPMTATVLAYDLYFTGTVTDAIEGIQFAPAGERYIGLIDTIDPHSSGVLGVYDFGPAGTNPSESGLLLITTAEDATGISGAVREAIPIRVRPERGRHGGHAH